MLKNSIGKTIKSAWIADDKALIICLTDDTAARIWDDERSCCEHRYMHTDDDLSQYDGATLLGVELRDVTHEDCGGDCKDCQFLAVLTDRGNFTIANYNIHNGYYGGFDIIVKED